MDGPTIAFVVLAVLITSLRAAWWWRSERRRTARARKPEGDVVVVREPISKPERP